jgi:undecaprenyl-diphosphatase
MGWEDPGLTFDVALHLGTLVALLWFFRVEWIAFIHSVVNVVQGNSSGPNERMVQFIVVGTLPGALVGLFAEDLIETYLRSPLVISFTLIALALVLVAAEIRGRREKSLEHVSWTDAIVIGAAQALALVPGVSRSGVTITAALFRGMTREAAARFSFFLSTPLISGAVAKKTFDLVNGGVGGTELTVLAVGIAASALVGYRAIAFLLRYLATNTTYVFVYYRIGLGIVVFLAFWSGFR